MSRLRDLLLLYHHHLESKPGRCGNEFLITSPGIINLPRMSFLLCIVADSTLITVDCVERKLCCVSSPYHDYPGQPRDSSAHSMLVLDPRYDALRLPLSLQSIIDSGSPSTLDIQNNIPSRFREFITELERFAVSERPTDLKAFDCAVAFNWRRWWPWLECALQTNRIFEHAESNLSPEIIDRAFACTIPVLSALTRVLCFSSTRATQSTLACKILDSSNFQELLSLAWVVAITQPHSPEYVTVVTQMLEMTKLELLVDNGRLHAFATQFEACCLKITGKCFVKLWKHRVTAMVEDDDALSSVTGQQVYLLLQLLRVPGNRANLYLDKANVAMKCLGHLWVFLMDHEIEGSELCSSTEIRIRCINSLSSCYLVWLSGGARWVAAALDRDLILMVAKTCHFLDGVRDSDQGCEIATRTAVITLRELVQRVHSYKAYHAVSRRVKSNLSWCAKRVDSELSVTPLRLRAGCEDVSLQEAWDALKREFYVTHAFECQRQHYEAVHRRECRDIASSTNEHPIYGQLRQHIIPSIDLSYMQDMVSVAIQIARDHGGLSDMVSRAKRDTSARLAVIFDLTKPTFGEYEIMSQKDALEDEEMADKERMELMIMDTDIFFCGRVPLCGDSSTLVVCTERQLLRDDGTIMDREDVVHAFRRMWSREYSKRRLRT
ncbi:hypothetical protein BT96DRAFT_951737 [Gymnopus androsaceus JB14]|uniref:Uncharacterized protein n=1 Tax=Gymnopus androsaceus JB14 TaxID=1447944 RepID=A0A6A4GBV5_9AGAR|nr:hypothetical protein BT96DRAFT_951737 [Gymnopus androsaceus JB14]